MNKRKANVFENLKEDVYQANMPEKEKQKILKNIMNLRDKKINIMITGATGCGKSSTINALFDMEIAKVGVGVDPETMNITKYELDNLILWDSPGLGDGKEADNRHARNIIKKLQEKDFSGHALIDLVLVILDGSTRDLGTSYELINSVIIPNLGRDKENRILVAINQCDVAMKGRYWNKEENKPEPPLVKFLEEKVQSVRRRIKEGTGVDIEPIYYSAGWKEEGEKQNPYNLSKLLYFIIQHTPKEKRLVYVNNLSRDTSVWRYNDNKKDYVHLIKKRFAETVSEYATQGAQIGKSIGSVFGKTGETIGGAIGGVVGGVVGAFKSWFS